MRLAKDLIVFLTNPLYDNVERPLWSGKEVQIEELAVHSIGGETG